MTTRRKRESWLLGNVVVPFLGGIGFVIAGIYKLTLAWWLDPWLQRRSNRALLDDIQAKLHFLISQAEDVKQSRAALPFDCASVEILWRNLFFNISRGRGELNVSVAPRHARNEQSEIGPTIAALEGRHFSENDIVNDLEDAAALLRPRLDLLNAAFSEQEYARTRKRI